MIPLVSVVIPTYNRPDIIGEALSSVGLQRNVPGPIEVIVVNDAGLDVTAAVDDARECLGLTVRLIDLTANRGLPAARNIGIDAAAGEFLALLDDDDVFLPQHLTTMLDAIDREGADAAYGICALSTRRVDPLAPQPTSTYPSHPFDPALLSVANFIPIHAPVLRRPPDRARFDTALPALEDWDMWLRLTQAFGYRFHHVPLETVVYHQLRDDDNMCAPSVRESAALARFSRLAQRLWARWDAPTEAARRFRLHIVTMYWNGLVLLAEGRRLRVDYFQRCLGHIAAAWHGDIPEDSITDRIVESMEETRGHADLA
ncbi:glycosyltransferase family 2 protein [Nocardia wallacei]|uniref:glycosyltransferase family 2 protein n=1 Tax=Nocardia wallacei TaxID=480035 RepID=UPI002455B17F|nr:glycosyltransferase family 2 protein [Nocardia wallacei]